MFNFRYSHLSVLNTEIYVEASAGKIITVQVEDSDTIRSLKVKIQNHEGISVDQQKLIFDGKELKNGNCTLDDYAIQRASMLRLHRRSRKATMKGGVYNCSEPPLASGMLRTCINHAAESIHSWLRRWFTI